MGAITISSPPPGVQAVHPMRLNAAPMKKPVNLPDRRELPMAMLPVGWQLPAGSQPTASASLVPRSLSRCEVRGGRRVDASVRSEHGLQSRSMEERA
jgi:hypothetical protein